MPTKRRPTGKTTDEDRIISVGRDRETGGAVIRSMGVDEVGRVLTARAFEESEWNGSSSVA